MAVGKGLQIGTFALRGEQIYNYFGTQSSVCLYYNRDNRFPISPIRRTWGSENRAILSSSRPNSSPPCRMLRTTLACIGLNETDLGHVYTVGRSTASSPRRGKQPVRERMCFASVHFLPGGTFAGEAKEAS